MNRSMEQPFASTFSSLAMAWVLGDIRYHAGIEDRLAIGLRIKGPIQVDIGALDTQPRQFGHPFQGFQPLWKQHGIRFIDRRYWQWRQDVAMVVNDGDDLFTLLVFVAGVANAITTFFGYRVGAIAMQ